MDKQAMAASNKILTVSYGAFTCTLEGFDAPFNTAHAIIEYYRDLAAEARVPGADALEPEADALMAIAQLEEHLEVTMTAVAGGVRLTQRGVRDVPSDDAAAQDPSPFPPEDEDPVAGDTIEGTDDPGSFAEDAVAVLYSRHVPDAPPSGLAGDATGGADRGGATVEIVEIEVEDEDGTPRLMTMTRSEFDAALAAGEIEEIGDTPGPNAAHDAIGADKEILALLERSSLDRQGREALALELTLLEQEAGADGGPHPEPATGRGRRRRRRASPLVKSADGTLDRLMDETDLQLRRPDANRRRTSIAHLKRAVAATVADGDRRDRWSGPERRLSDFRQDLDQAVRPGPAADGPSARPEPLRLGASEMVPPGKDPARSADPEASPVPHRSFSEFARDMNASDLSDLIVAAAAYSAAFDGGDGATRPDLIGQAAAVHEGIVSREDGLGSFAKVLRMGRIRKLDTGRFTVAEPGTDVRMPPVRTG